MKSELFPVPMNYSLAVEKLKNFHKIVKPEKSGYDERIQFLASRYRLLKKFDYDLEQGKRLFDDLDQEFNLILKIQGGESLLLSFSNFYHHEDIEMDPVEFPKMLQRNAQDQHFNLNN